MEPQEILDNPVIKIESDDDDVLSEIPEYNQLSASLSPHTSLHPAQDPTAHHTDAFIVSQQILDPNVEIEIDESVSPFISSQSSVISEPHNLNADAIVLTQPILSFVPDDASAFPGPYVPTESVDPLRPSASVGPAVPLRPSVPAESAVSRRSIRPKTRIPAGFQHTFHVNDVQPSAPQTVQNNSQSGMNNNAQLVEQHGFRQGARYGFRVGFRRGFLGCAQHYGIQPNEQNDAQTILPPVLPHVSQHRDSTITQPDMQSVVEPSVDPVPTAIATQLAGIENLSPEAQAQLVTSIADDIQTSIATICRHLRDGTLSRDQVKSLDKVIKWVKGKDRKTRKRLESRAGKLERQYGSLVGNLADITAMHRRRLGQIRQMRERIDDLVREGEMMTGELVEVRERLRSVTCRHLGLVSQKQGEDAADLVSQNPSESSSSLSEVPSEASEDQIESSSSSSDEASAYSPSETNSE
ncbi:hypothetical protein N7488_007197 [Penicillium malachiteum]|nr:hypothetical protein N7488_007197 [Penicillium malachiteum]